MKSLFLLKRPWMNLIVLATIGLASLAVTFARIPSNQVFIDGNRVESSAFALNFYNNSNAILFSVSPLNDYLYSDTTKIHLEEKIVEVNNGSLIQNLWFVVRDLVLDKKSLAWNTNGNIQEGKASVDYLVSQTKKGLEIQRTITVKPAVNKIGQVIKFCADCLVTDDSNKVYFNAETVTKSDIDTATRLNLTTVIVRESQFFPPSVSLIKIIDRENNLKMEIPLNGAQVYLQYKWRLLEFKAGLSKGVSSIKQEIFL